MPVISRIRSTKKEYLLRTDKEYFSIAKDIVLRIRTLPAQDEGKGKVHMSYDNEQWFLLGNIRYGKTPLINRYWINFQLLRGTYVWIRLDARVAEEAWLSTE